MATRRETVHLEVTGGFTGEMAQAAASVALLRRELDGLGRTRVNTSVNQSFSQMDRGARQADSSINQLTGRLSLFADAALILGPGLAPLAAVGAQALGGLAAAATAVAVAGGSAIVAFQGLGDAVKAIDAYQLDPTVANLEKAQAAMDKIGPQAQRFVKEFQDFQPVLTDIQRAAAKGWFPGLSDSLDDFARLAPVIEKIFTHAGRAGGNIVEDTADSLDSKRWRPFLHFLDREVPDAMRSLATIMGDLAHGLSEMFMTLDPANDRFLGWLEDVADGFDNWARSSQGRDDIQAFMDYAQQNGPEVEAFFLALVDAIAQISEAAGPLGGATLTALTKILEAVAAIADSDLGTPFFTGLIALRLYTRGLAIAQAAQSRLASTPLGAANAAAGRAGSATAIPFVGATTTASSNLGLMQQASAAQRSARLGMFARGAGTAAGLGFLLSGAADDMNATNTATLTLAGSMAGPLGAGIGAVVGGLMDLQNVGDGAAASVDRMRLALDAGSFDEFNAAAKDAQAEIEALTEKANADQSSAGWKGAIPFVGGYLGGKSSSEGQKAAEEARKAAEETEGLAMEADAAAFAMGAVAAGVGKIPPPMREAASYAQDFTRQLQKAQGFLDRNGAIDAYEASIDALSKSIKENGTSFDRTTNKGRANRAALRDIASSGLVAAEKLKGLAKVEFMNNLRGQFKEAADKLHLNQDQTDRWMRQLGILDRIKAIPTIDANNSPLEVAVAASKALLASINGDTAVTYIKTIRLGGDAVPGGPRGGSYGSADGGSVPKTGLPYADRHHYLLADGEEVISNRHGQADRHRSLLKAINAGRLADGGTTGDGGGGMDLVGGLGGAANGAARALKGLRHELDKSRKVLEKEKQKREEFLSIRSEVGSSLTGSLTGTGLAGFDLGVAAGTNDNRQAIRNLIELKKKGLDGPLFDLVAGSGDPALIAQFADLSRKQINQRERRYGALTSSQNRLGSLAAEAQVGQTLSSLNATIKELNKKIDTLEHRVERGAHKGTRGRKKDQDRETRNRTRSRR